MTGKTDNLQNVPIDRALKLNAEGAGNYRAQYDDPSWNLLLASLPSLNYPDRVNLLCDSWALAEANRAQIALYLGIVEKLPTLTILAEREQIVTVFDYIDRLFVGSVEREKFQGYARTVLRPSFDQLGWDPKPNEPPTESSLRASLIAALGTLNDKEIINGCRDRFQKFLDNPAVIAPDLRRTVIQVVGRYADEPTWNKLRELGLKTTNIGEKQNYYDALTHATDQKLIRKTLEIALSDELPTSRAIFLVGKVARYSDHPEIVWEFARANMKALLGKADALAINSYAPSLFTFFSEKGRAEELKAYAKANLPPTSAKEVAKAVDEIEFRAEFKPRLAKQLEAWIDDRASGNKR
jgi:aminopeptidase N